MGSLALFTQESLVVFVDVIKSVRSISRKLDGAEWPLERVSTLMAILKGEFGYELVHSCGGDGLELFLGVLTYPNSPDYRPDIDNLSPVQVGSNSVPVPCHECPLNALLSRPTSWMPSTESN